MQALSEGGVGPDEERTEGHGLDLGVLAHGGHTGTGRLSQPLTPGGALRSPHASMDPPIAAAHACASRLRVMTRLTVGLLSATVCIECGDLLAVFVLRRSPRPVPRSAGVCPDDGMFPCSRSRPLAAMAPPRPPLGRELPCRFHVEGGFESPLRARGGNGNAGRLKCAARICQWEWGMVGSPSRGLEPWTTVIILGCGSGGSPGTR